jgi:uncharacterized membrane protein
VLCGAVKKKLKNIFLTGLAVIVPAGLTLYILVFIIGIMDGLLTVIPDRYQPDTLLHFHVPGLGAIVTVILIFICGLIAQSYFGNRVVAIGERLVERIPVIRSVYQALKRITDSIFTDKNQSFKKVVLVEYPRKGLYAVGFVTASAAPEMEERLGRRSTGVFLPLALTPTTGFFVIVPENELIYLDMSVEQAFTLIVSAGIVTPPARTPAVMPKAAGDVPL